MASKGLLRLCVLLYVYHMFQEEEMIKRLMKVAKPTEMPSLQPRFPLFSSLHIYMHMT